MRKFIVAFIALLLICVAPAMAANVMDTYTWTFTIIADTIPPRVISVSPENGAVNIPVLAPITVVLEDTETGIDTTSIVMKINDVVASPLDAVVNGKQVTVKYQPVVPFEYGKPVAVSIQVKDKAQ